MYCAKCGAILSEGANFCTECGAPVGGNPETGSVQRESIETQARPHRVKNEPSSKRRFRVIYSVIPFIVGYLVIAWLQHTFPFEQSYDAQLQKASNEFNTTLPQTIDNQTTLVSTTVAPGKNWYYLFEMKNYSRSDFTAAQIDLLRKRLTTQVINGVRSTSEMKAMRDHDVTFHYDYNDKNGTRLFEITVTPSEYR